MGSPQSCWRNTPITNSIFYVVCSVQFSHSVMSDSLKPHGLQHARCRCSSPSQELGQTHVHRVGDPSNCLILCHPLFLLPSIFPSNRVFSNESVLHISWPKYWRFNFRIGPSNEYSGLISFRVIEWISLQSKGHLRVLCNTTVQNHQFFITHHSLWCNCHIHT